jgi:hypothetical protein
MNINPVNSINTTPMFDPTDNKTTTLELQLFTLPVNDLLILSSHAALHATLQKNLGGFETQEVKGSVVIKNTKEEIPFDFKINYKAIHNSNGETDYVLDSFTGNVNNNQVKISGSVNLPSNVEEPRIINIKVDSNGKNDSFISKLYIAKDNYNIIFSNVILGQEGALKEEKAIINIMEVLKLLLTGTNSTVYEAKGKILGTEKEEKVELELDSEFLTPAVKGPIKGKFGNNNLTGSFKIKSNELEVVSEVEKDYGDYLIKYTIK